jgi:hypothetical protein
MTPVEAAVFRDLRARLRLEHEGRIALEIELLEAKKETASANRHRLRAVGRAKEYRTKSRDVIASTILRVDRRLRSCVYCGAPSRAPACFAHSDLLYLDDLAPK